MKIKLIILISVVVIFIIAIILISYSWRNSSSISKITVKGNNTVDRYEILESAGLLDSTQLNIETLNLLNIENKILKHPEVKKVRIMKEPPSELVIEIIEKRPFAIININNELKLVDEELEVFPFKNFEKIYDLPVINGLVSDIKGTNNADFYKEDLKTSFFIIRNLAKKSKYMYSLISEINFEDNEKIKIFSNDYAVPFYLPKQKGISISDTEYQNQILYRLTVFRNFQEQFSGTKEKIRYVDLRFKNQVLIKFN